MSRIETGLDRRDFLGLTASLPLWGPAWAQARAGAPRVAVVIGNAAYAVGPLANPGKDAGAMSALLREMGFRVVLVQDAVKARMQAALDEAQKLLQGQQGVGLFYYAGHGLQLDWRNYLLPVDAALSQAADVPVQALDVQAVLACFKAAGTAMNILVLDACRDNPFGSAGSSLATAKGLAPLDAPPGTFFAYATAPGNVAEDGSAQDGSGLYTRYLLQEMKRPEARIEDVFKRVRLQVRQASAGRQIPWESTSLEQDFIFATGQRSEAATGQRREREFDDEKAEWDRIKASSQPEDFYAFLRRHPSGLMSELAQFRLDQLSRAALQAQPAAAGLSVLPGGADRFRVGDAWAMQRIDFKAGGSEVALESRVTALQGGRVIINGGLQVMDQMGSVLLNRFGAKDPGVLVAPSGLQVGKRWRSAFINTPPGQPPSRNFYDNRVAALEDVEVPAGTFRAYRIEARGEAVMPAQVMELANTSWIDPVTMTLVRQDVRHRQQQNQWVTEDFRLSLLWRRQVPRA